MKKFIFLFLILGSQLAYSLSCEMPEVGNLSELQKILSSEDPQYQFRKEYCNGYALCSECSGSESCLKKYDDKGREIPPPGEAVKEDDGRTCQLPKSHVYGVDQRNLGRKSGSCGMNDEERAIIDYYSGSGYSCLNSYLRSTFKHPVMDLMVQTLDAALNKLPDYKGFVVRGAKLPDHIRDLHKEGSKVMYDAFTSTSTSVGFGGDDNFIILSSHGKPIMGFSDIEEENEVLFKSRTTFKVLHRYQEDGRNFYVMKEVNEKLSASEEAAEDKRDMDYYLQKKEMISKRAKVDKGDTWYCPLDSKTPIVPSVQQTRIPLINPSYDSSSDSGMLP